MKAEAVIVANADTRADVEALTLIDTVDKVKAEALVHGKDETLEEVKA